MGKYNDEPYLRSEDLLRDGKYLGATLEIEDVLEGAPITRKLKPIQGLALKFKGRDKVLGLGATNEALCKTIFGDTRHQTWIGKSVTIAVRRVRGMRKGETQPAIRIIPPPGTEVRSGLARELGEAYTYAEPAK
jgi:hypothetical protein